MSASTHMIVEPAARDRVVELLSRHFANDAISLAEFESRLDRAFAATRASQLGAVVADLPRADDAPASPDHEANPARQRVTAILSGQEQRVAGLVPRRVELRSRLGYIEIDFTRATFAPGVTELDVRAFMGYVQIRLPANVHVECRGRAAVGFFSLDDASGSDDRDAERIIRITGRATLGFAACSLQARGRPPGARAGR